MITGCEERYTPLLAGLIGSIEGPARAHQIDIGLLDFGLSAECSSAYARRGVSVVTPEWDFDPSLFSTPPADYFKAMTTRPHLRKYFPGYDCYMWMDTDTWVQDWSGVQLYLASAETFGVAVTPEVDRSYASLYSPTMTVMNWRRECFLRCFDETIADKLALYPTINSGVFAVKANSPVWDIWSRTLGRIFAQKHETFFFAEQTALNAAIRLNGVRAGYLPSTCNWMCNRALPVCSEDGTELREPNPPFHRLRVLHLTSNTKNGTWPLSTVTGATRPRSLRFRGHDSAQVGPDIALPQIGALPQN